MEKNKDILNIASILALLIGICFLFLNADLINFQNLVNLNLYQFTESSFLPGHNTTNLLYNTYHTWSFDPLLNQLIKNFPTDAYPIAFTYSYFFFLTGLFFCFEHFNTQDLNKYQKYFYSLSYALIFIIVLLITWQSDLVLISSLTWLPYFILAVDHFLKGKFASLPFLLLSSILLILSSNQLSLFYIIFFCFFLSTSNPNQSHTNLKKKYNLVIFTLILMASVLWIFTYSLPEFPNYPGNARVLETDYTPGIARPLFGPSSPIEFQDLKLPRDIFFIPLIVLSIFTLLFLIYEKGKSKSLWFLFSSFLILLLDSSLPADLAHIMPLETIGLLVPHWYYFPLLSYFLLSATLCLIINLISRHHTLLVLLVTFCFAFSAWHSTSNNTNYQNKISKIQELNLTNLKFLNSPSANILINNSDLDLKRIKKAGVKKFMKLRKKTEIVETNYNSEVIKLSYDNDLTTRWSSKLAKQTGDEQILIKLNKPKKVWALEFSPGKKNYTDFPRGLKIDYQENCGSNYKNIYEQEKWPGAIALTSDGFPYYKHQSHVKIVFPPTLIECIKITQIGRDAHFEWSISEIRLAYAKN